MNARLHMLFQPITEADFETLRRVANRVTIDPKSVRVSSSEQTNWLIVDFTMARQLQISAVDAIDRALEFDGGRCSDTIIQFPRSDAEEARAKRKNEKCKAIRRANRIQREADRLPSPHSSVSPESR